MGDLTELTTAATTNDPRAVGALAASFSGARFHLPLETLEGVKNRPETVRELGARLPIHRLRLDNGESAVPLFTSGPLCHQCAERLSWKTDGRGIKTLQISGSLALGFAKDVLVSPENRARDREPFERQSAPSRAHRYRVDGGGEGATTSVVLLARRSTRSPGLGRGKLASRHHPRDRRQGPPAAGGRRPSARFGGVGQGGDLRESAGRRSLARAFGRPLSPRRRGRFREPRAHREQIGRRGSRARVPRDRCGASRQDPGRRGAAPRELSRGYEREPPIPRELESSSPRRADRLATVYARAPWASTSRAFHHLLLRFPRLSATSRWSRSLPPRTRRTTESRARRG